MIAGDTECNQRPDLPKVAEATSTTGEVSGDDAL
jgi:hypothetical protein